MILLWICLVSWTPSYSGMKQKSTLNKYTKTKTKHVQILLSIEVIFWRKTSQYPVQCISKHSANQSKDSKQTFFQRYLFMIVMSHMSLSRIHVTHFYFDTVLITVLDDWKGCSMANIQEMQLIIKDNLVKLRPFFLQFKIIWLRINKPR